jgi:uncharacterized protein
MFAELDRVLEPQVLAARGWRLRADAALQEWPRLAAVDEVGGCVAGPGREVRVDIVFREDDTGAAVLEGELAVTLSCICQRCLENMALDLQATPRLVFGAAEQLGIAAAEAGFESCEPEPGVTLRQLLEDEILLAMPVFPVHERREDCGALADRLAELEPAASGEGSSGPFAVLAGLKRKD